MSTSADLAASLIDADAAADDDVIGSLPASMATPLPRIGGTRRRGLRSFARSALATQGRAIRPFSRQDLPACQQLARRAMPLLNRNPLRYDGHVLLLCDGTRLLGMIKGRALSLDDGRHIGIISWLIIDPDVQALGMAGILIEELLRTLENDGCSEIIATIHVSNTASARGVAHYGFTPISLAEQWRLYGMSGVPGVSLFRLLLAAFHLIDYGHLLWRRPPAAENAEPAESPAGVPSTLRADLRSWLCQLLLQIAAAGLVWRAWTPAPSAVIWPAAIAAVTLSMTLRHALTLRLARAVPRLRYRAWDSGMAFSLILGLLTSVWWPCPGSLVCTAPRYKVSIFTRMQSRAALHWSLTLLLLCGGSLLINTSLHRPLLTWFNRGLAASSALEHLITFFPFQSLGGGLLRLHFRRIHPLLSAAWVLLAILGWER